VYICLNRTSNTGHRDIRVLSKFNTGASLDNGEEYIDSMKVTPCIPWVISCGTVKLGGCTPVGILDTSLGSVTSSPIFLDLLNLLVCSTVLNPTLVAFKWIVA
jgi:hypothetical protein